MVEQTTGTTVGGVYRTHETPGLGTQLAHSGGLHVGEEATTMHTAEMGEETEKVELVGHHGPATGLLHVQTTGRDQVAGGQKVLHLLAHVRRRVHHLAHVLRFGRLRLAQVHVTCDDDAYCTQPLGQVLLEQGQIDMSTLIDLLVTGGVRVVGHHVTLREQEEFAQHEHQKIVLGSVRVQVHKDVLAQQHLTGLCVREAGRRIDNTTEQRSQIGQYRCSRVTRPLVGFSKNHLDTIRNKCIDHSLSTDQLFVELTICSVNKGTQQQTGRNEVLLLHDLKANVAVAVRQIVQGDCARGLIGTTTTNAHTLVCVVGTTFAVCLARDRHRIVSTRSDQQTNHTLVTVTDEVAAHLVLLFTVSHQLSRSKTMQSAVCALYHDGKLSELCLDGARWHGTHLIAHGGKELRRVGCTGLTTLSRIERLMQGVTRRIGDLNVLEPQ
mmetsp:Transcript_29489/g.74196  ORF Transcript_29489/g.74196 Transcript_29489/m.74196 type:complete len:438 (+) Transcript_29489:1990-3303(+)